MPRKTLSDGLGSNYLIRLWPEARPTGADLWIARDKIGASQGQMAELLGVTKWRIVEWEGGGQGFLIPSPPIAREIAYILQIPLEELGRYERTNSRRPRRVDRSKGVRTAHSVAITKDDVDEAKRLGIGLQAYLARR